MVRVIPLRVQQVHADVRAAVSAGLGRTWQLMPQCLDAEHVLIMSEG